jgi:GNAT superfamily N-acetyltransferase
MSEIFICTTSRQRAEAFAVMKELRPHLSEETFTAAVERMSESQGYQLAALRHQGHIVAVAGYRIGESLSWGRFLYVDDLVTSGAARSGGFGKALNDWLEQYAKAQGCEAVHLDSGVQRHGAHRFYLRERFDIVFYHFRKDI